MHRPVDDLARFDAEDLATENQVAIVPASHRFASYQQLPMADVQKVPDLPMARWPRIDGSYPEGPEPEVHNQLPLAHQVALGQTLLIIPTSSRAWQWPEHLAVSAADAPEITTVVAWLAGSRSHRIRSLVRTASTLESAPAQ